MKFLVLFVVITVLGLTSSLQAESYNNPLNKRITSRNKRNQSQLVNKFSCNEHQDWSEILQTKIGESSIECISKNPIKWMFTNTWRLLNTHTKNASIPLKIHSEMKKCNENEFDMMKAIEKKNESMAPQYYFRSVLDLENLVKTEQNNSAEVFTFIGCGDYSSNFGFNEKERRIWMLKKTIKGFEISNYVVSKWDLSPFYTTAEPINLRLNNDRVTGKCTCQDGKLSRSPSFLSCNRLDHCELLIEKQFNGNGRRGKLENFCNTFSVRDLMVEADLKKPGLLYCQMNENMIYVPYILTKSHRNNLSTLRILSSNASFYGSFLNITFHNPDRVYAHGNLAVFSCSGPKFLFMKEIRWKLLSSNFSQIQNVSFQSVEQEDKLISSKLTIQLVPFSYGVNFTVICEAVVRNTPEIVQSKLTIVTEQKPKINESIRCSTETEGLFEYKCDSVHGAKLSWHDENHTDFSPEGAMVKNHSIVMSKCPKKTVICTATKNGVFDSKQFSPFDCLQFLLLSNACGTSSANDNNGIGTQEATHSANSREKIPVSKISQGKKDNGVLLSLVLYIRDQNGQVTGTISGNFSEFSGQISKFSS